ncbi:MAG: hypothetical protein ABI237_05870 [Ginsengibacter sp.]
MEFANIAFIVIIIAIVFTFAKPLMDRFQSGSLNKKFISVGSLVGKRYSEIQKVVGNPSIKEDYGDSLVLTWDSPNYAIKLKFDKDHVCTAKLGEVSKR